MEKYKSKIKEEIFITKYKKDIDRLAIKFLDEYENAGGVLEDAIADFAIYGTKAMTYGTANTQEIRKIIKGALGV